jgi:hypothetical protein
VVETTDEFENVTPNLTTVTIKHLFPAIYHEGRCPLGVEWTTPNELNARAPELDVLGDNVLDLTYLAHGLDEFFSNAHG